MAKKKKYNKTCKYCKKNFKGNSPNSQYCSIKCKYGYRDSDIEDKEWQIDPILNYINKEALRRRNQHKNSFDEHIRFVVASRFSTLAISKCRKTYLEASNGLLPYPFFTHVETLKLLTFQSCYN